ncbi:MAG TPA: hypothetical protein VNM37_03760, partial [Candidatus Dormibacteraeota bacterium]|nr:hypothetical protein [Candidatus Dormibacteraeota bacterium]
FWFAVQAPDKRNYGMELNNHPNEVDQTSQLLPAADFKVYNLTIIGSGALNTNISGGVNAAIALRPWAGPKIYNAIFTDFNAQGVLLDTQNGVTATQAVTSGTAQLHNTLWWNFVTGSGTKNIDNTATNLGRFSLATNYWTDASLVNQIADPMLTSISRTNVGAFLDPRPAPGSPANSDYASAPAGLETANYRGAFGPGRSNWAADWTALSEYGIMGGSGGGNPRPVPTPTQPPGITLIATINGGSLNISFLSRVGLQYQLETRVDLASGAWADSGAPLAGTGSLVTMTAPLGSGGMSFFRVRAF